MSRSILFASIAIIIGACGFLEAPESQDAKPIVLTENTEKWPVSDYTVNALEASDDGVVELELEYIGCEDISVDLVGTPGLKRSDPPEWGGFLSFTSGDCENKQNTKKSFDVSPLQESAGDDVTITVYHPDSPVETRTKVRVEID